MPWGERFSFYDQVHTTGMDIKQVLDARAVLTLGKDMTFRDYAQGAFRMRGIGAGQTIQLFIIPEVRKLIEEQVAASKDDAATKTAQLLNRVIQLEQHQIALEGALNKMHDDISAFWVELRDLKKCVARAFPREEFELFKFEFLADQQELKQRVDLCLQGAVLSVFFCSD